MLYAEQPGAHQSQDTGNASFSLSRISSRSEHVVGGIAFRVLELAPGGLARSRMRYPSDELEPQQRVSLRTDRGGD